MKNIMTTLLIGFLGSLSIKGYAVTLETSFQYVNNPFLKPPVSERKIQIAILFDTSNSMDGLIDQAKARVWNIVNEATSYRYQNEIPQLEIALFQYGNSRLQPTSNFIQQILPFSTDLDEISKQLFALTTSGGSEYCGAVIQQSLDELSWSSHPNDLKMIYIAGNEPFNQGPIDYKKACQFSKDKKVFVNTIYCGDYNQGQREFWNDCAGISNGNFFHIDANKSIQQIATPQDPIINAYNDSLNKTYYGYGSLGNSKKMEQTAQDSNAEQYSQAIKAERSISKSKTVYKNDSWDIVDAVENKQKDITKMKDEELPTELKGKTTAEKEKFIKDISQDRKRYQEKIAALAIERQNYIDAEAKKNAEQGKVADDFGTSVNETIKLKAVELGFEKEVIKNP